MSAPRLAAAIASDDDWGEDAPTASLPRLSPSDATFGSRSGWDDEPNGWGQNDDSWDAPSARNLSSTPTPRLAPTVPASPRTPEPSRPSRLLLEDGSDDWSDDSIPAPEAGGSLLDVDEEPEALQTKRTRSKKSPAKRASRAARPSKKLSSSGLRLTPRDIEILSFLGRYRCATVHQIARHVSSSVPAIRNRLPRIAKEGMLSWSYTGVAKPKVWTVTDTGLKVAGLSLSAPSISWGTLRHTLGLVDLGTTFELAGENVVTEREIRAALRYTPTDRMRTAIDLHASLLSISSEMELEDTSIAADRYTIPVRGKSHRHIPDMVVVRNPLPDGTSGSIAVELELNRKTLSDWNSILTAYRDSTQFAQVVYYVVDGDVEKALRGVVHATGAEHRVSIVKFQPLDNTATP